MTLLFDTGYLFVRALKKLAPQSHTHLLLPLPADNLPGPVHAAIPLAQSPAGLSSKGVSYLEYASAGILMQNAFSSSLQSGTSIVEDLNSGFLQKMLVTQVSRPAILLGRLATDAFRVTVQSVIILALAYALGFRLASGIPGAIAHSLHNRILRFGVVGHLARPGSEDEELGDGLRDWGSSLPSHCCS